METRRSITIIGSGSYGTALAITLSRNGHHVFLWGRNSKHQEKLKVDRCNNTFLPGIIFPKTLKIKKNLYSAINASNNLLLVVPSKNFSTLLYTIKPFLNKKTRIVWATKGLEKNTGCFLKEVARNVLGKNIPLAIISGPSFAKELAMGLPTTIILSATEKNFAKDLKELFHYDKNLKVYKNYDFIGVQLGGVIKNIIAIGAGISDGIGFGANARTALITRGLKEMIRLGVTLGANANTFLGMSGLGDLMLSCTDNQSRNRRFGILLGQGVHVKKAQKLIGQTVEGFYNTKEVKKLANKNNLIMPITEQIYQILYLKKSAYKAIMSLLCRENKNEDVI